MLIAVESRFHNSWNRFAGCFLIIVVNSALSRSEISVSLAFKRTYPEILANCDKLEKIQGILIFL